MGMLYEYSLEDRMCLGGMETLEEYNERVSNENSSSDDDEE
jgi:hypothetical protein